MFGISLEYVWIMSALPIALLSSLLYMLLCRHADGDPDLETSLVFFFLGLAWPVVVALVLLLCVILIIHQISFYLMKGLWFFIQKLPR